MPGQGFVLGMAHYLPIKKVEYRFTVRGLCAAGNWLSSDSGAAIIA
jgi:hypothetical protein